MPKRKKRFSGVYTPEIADSFGFKFIDSPTSEIALEDYAVALDDPLPNIDGQFIDGCLQNQAYLDCLTHNEIIDMSKLQLFQNIMTASEDPSTKIGNNKSKDSIFDKPTYEDLALLHIPSEVKLNIIELHSSF